MPAHVVRKRFFIAVEGESEQSFVAWLQALSAAKLHVYLDSVPLGGGGYKSMLEAAVRQHARRCKTRGAYRARFLIVDEDRAQGGDWPIERLRLEAAKHQITVCVQRPNHEGLLLRMMHGMERGISDASSAEAKLRSRWPSYKKPANARALGRQFSAEDLLRVAKADPDLETLLNAIGLKGGP
jgi:hypothetical protein